MLVGFLLLGGGIFWWHQRVADTPASANPTVAARPVDATDPRPSIAVLPFENRSPEADDTYFVDGIHDDILTQLSRVSGLRVISRTSVSRFRNTDLSVQQIAQQLGVKSILEGGVQRAGDRVRVTVQLVDAHRDEHVWAENYDRELTAANIFAIQSEVASAIADVLRTKLTPVEQARRKSVPTHNLAAWEAYQLGQQRMTTRSTKTLADAEEFFREAIALDPKFALAYVGLAIVLNLQIEYSGVPIESVLAEAQEVV
jgi:TolB-like protein